MLCDGEYMLTVFVHAGLAYTTNTTDMPTALRVFSAMTHDKAPQKNTAQAFVVNRGYVDYAGIKNPNDVDWLVTQLERKNGGVWEASKTHGWKHTLDVLRRDHDEDLVVAPAKEKVVEDLEESGCKRARKQWLPSDAGAQVYDIALEWQINDTKKARERWTAWLASDEGKAAIAADWTDSQGIGAEWRSNDQEATGKRWEAWLASEEGAAKMAERKKILEHPETAAPWGGEVVVLGEKRKATEEPERTS
jgi:hypothetical protein